MFQFSNSVILDWISFRFCSRWPNNNDHTYIGNHLQCLSHCQSMYISSARPFACPIPAIRHAVMQPTDWRRIPDKAIGYNRPSLAMMHIILYDDIIIHVFSITHVWRRIAHPDRLIIGGPSHGYIILLVYNKLKLIEAIIFELRTDNQTNKQTNRPNCITLALVSGSDGK